MTKSFKCDLCNLCRFTNPVQGYGNENAQIMIIGEAPGCFIGSTKVKLLNGMTKTMKELVQEYKNKSFWVYSSTKKGKIVAGLASNPRKTKKARKLIKITLDNKNIEICTPNHLWLMKDGSYKRADELLINDSLMPLYTKWSEDKKYEWCYLNDEQRWIQTHYISYGKKGKRRYVLHHKDFNSKNNEPTNLELMLWIDHRDLHSKHMKELWKDPLFKKKISDSTRERMILLNQNEDYVRKRNKWATKTIISYNKYKKSNSNLKFKEWRQLQNHKIISIETINKYEDVYDITVEKYHNFALASGVFVHNSEEAQYGKPFIGRAGKLLDACLEEAELNRDDLYITNILLGRPPENKINHVWAKEALEICPQTYLQQTINRIKPKVIILLGNTPLGYFHDMTGITKVRGKVISWNGIPTIPALHPAYFLRGKINQSHLLVSDLRLAKKTALKNKSIEYILTDTYDNSMQLLTQIDEEITNFSIDTETTGLNVYKEQIIGICLAFDDYTGYYMPIRKREIFGDELTWFHEKQKDILELVKKILGDEKKAKAMHMANYDFRMFRNDLGIETKGTIVDTMITYHLTNENTPKTLHYLSQRYSDLAGYDDDVERMKKVKNLNMIDIPLKDMTPYGAGDAIVTFREAKRTVKILKGLKT